MKLILKCTLAALVCAAMSTSAMATSASDILSRVRAAEAGVSDLRADMVIDQANKKNVSGMGENYGDILKLEKAVITYKKPNMIRYDGYAQGIKAVYVQNGYTKLVILPMIKQRENEKDAPGKRQDTLDLGFLSSKLWTDNRVSVEPGGNGSVVKLKFAPRFGGSDKRHDLVWVDSKTLRVLKLEKYLGSGELRVSVAYSNFQMLGSKLPIATTSTMYNRQGKALGTVSYKNLKSNIGLNDSLFSLNQR